MKTISPDRIPDRTGPAGRAWRINMRAARAAALAKGRADADATVAAWIIDCPGAHIAWRNYLLYAVHLRPTDGLPPAKIALDGASHEIGLYALDPDREPDLLSPMSTHLRPANFIGQWNAASDIDADSAIERCVEDIVGGLLNPDTDARQQWIDRFSDSNLKKNDDGPTYGHGKSTR